MNGETITRIAEALTATSLFSGSSRQEIVSLLSGVRYSRRTVEPGTLVASRGDRYERLLIVIDGTLSAEIIDLRGRVLKMESLEAPSVVASGILFSSENELPVQLRAETRVTILAFPREAVLELCRKSETFLSAFLRDAGNRITFLAEKIYLFSFHTLRQKIAVYFLDLHARQKTELFPLPYTIETLAELFGVSRPSLSRSLSELVEEGLLVRQERRYGIGDLEGLRALAEGAL